MDKRKLNRVFEKIKKEAKLDYAVTSPDIYGDCNTCVNCELSDEFGKDSTGIYAKHWTRGMNAGGPWKDVKDVYVGHDITEEQGVTVIRIFKESGYNICPEVYDSKMSFRISEKEN